MKSFFNNLKLGNKMLTAPLVVFIFLFILGYFTLSGLLLQRATIEEIFNNRFKGYQASAKMLADISNVHGTLSKILNLLQASRDMKITNQDMKKQIEELSKQQLAIMEEDVALARKILKSSELTPEERKSFQAALDNVVQYQQAASQFMEIAPGGIVVSISLPDEQFNIVNKVLISLQALEEKLSKEKYEASMQGFTVTLTMFLTIFVVAAVISFLTSLLITRMVVKPINEVINVVHRFAEGDLTHSIQLNSKDEIGELVNSVNLMRDKMGAAVGQALQVSKMLSDSASQEAASIEETSASLDEIASMTRQNAANTSEANQLMISVKDAIRKANDSMAELTRSMKEINGASEQTQKIVKSIDEISFQTNLLALNASVEAARAGDAGAGFAVVAEEVRNLAMRATESARSSNNLIEDIVNKVKSGESLAGATRTAFNQVTTSAEKVVGIMGEIAAASEEQSQGIDQVNTAIAGMNIATQQNADNAEKLSTIMSIFRTDTGSGFQPEKQFLPQPKELVTAT